ncbi:hypothetical protein CWATWH0402_1267 [Crocosphaera watsonii WH 0402]|uniref:Uncharacterized protein n=1 Tax=Crocosphaera watsonii WH 0402 TaxID=1284629 RepID=T2JVR6_CROWT|nr:hypothetical protein CWATWH0402_1267 [Crocosphaera watsonii WH 0402]
MRKSHPVFLLVSFGRGGSVGSVGERGGVVGGLILLSPKKRILVTDH